jgi:hypothetical protein
MLRWLVYQLQVYLRRKDRVDKFSGYQETALVRELVQKNRWRELEAPYASLRQDEKNVVTSALADVMQAGAFDSWVDARGSALAHSVKGRLELDLAWRVRSGAAASLVRKDAWKKYRSSAHGIRELACGERAQPVGPRAFLRNDFGFSWVGATMSRRCTSGPWAHGAFSDSELSMRLARNVASQRSKVSCHRGEPSCSCAR